MGRWVGRSRSDRRSVKYDWKKCDRCGSKYRVEDHQARADCRVKALSWELKCRGLLEVNERAAEIVRSLFRASVEWHPTGRVIGDVYATTSKPWALATQAQTIAFARRIATVTYRSTPSLVRRVLECDALLEFLDLEKWEPPFLGKRNNRNGAPILASKFEHPFFLQSLADLLGWPVYLSRAGGERHSGKGAAVLRATAGLQRIELKINETSEYVPLSLESAAAFRASNAIIGSIVTDVRTRVTEWWLATREGTRS